MMGTDTDTRIGDSLVGQVVNGAYRIDHLIGRGGMGNVYEAVQLCLNRQVAIKVMSTDLAASRESFALFRREAEVTSALGHPHIVQVFDFGVTAAGAPYMVLELLAGEDLDRAMRRCGRLSFRRSLHVIKQVAAALAATHAKGVIHQDLKPANVFLQSIPGEPDFVKVLDFGVSQVRPATPSLAQPTILMGTPHYMSPEQALGQVEHIDERTDQWALACMAWEALSGRAPFVGGDVQALLSQVVHGDPAPLPSMLSSFCPELERVLRRALAKDKKARFADVLQFADALENAIGRPKAKPYKIREPEGTWPVQRGPAALPTVLNRPLPDNPTGGSGRTPSNALADGTGTLELPAAPRVAWWQQFGVVQARSSAASWSVQSSCSGAGANHRRRHRPATYLRCQRRLLRN